MSRAPQVIAVMAAAAIGGASFGQWTESDAVEVRHLTGTELGDLFGWIVISLGDLTGDGIPDFAACSPFNDEGGASSGGRVAAYSGATGSQIWARAYDVQSGILGYALEATPDMNGDGFPDVLAGAPFGANGGQAFLYSGRNGSIIHTFSAPFAGASFGSSVAADGDFDGDGVSDIAIAAPSQGSGAVSVYSGVDFSLILSLKPLNLPAAEFGISCVFVGEPGEQSELAVGMRLAPFSPGNTIGKVELLSLDGSTTTVTNTIANVDMGAPLGGDRFTGGMDLTGDGDPDLVLGEQLLDRVRVIDAATGVVHYTVSGFAGSRFGSPSVNEDLTGDGLPDLVVGARSDDSGAANGGKVFMYRGADGELLRTMTHTVASAAFGAYATVLGDVDDDDIPDLVVGASGLSGLSPTLGHMFIMKGISHLDGSPADLNGDGVVNVLDLLQMLGAWGANPGHPADLTGDGVVNVLDLLQMLGMWG